MKIKAFISISEKTLDMPSGKIPYLCLSPPTTEQELENKFRDILDFCYANSCRMDVINEIFIICNEVDLLQEIRDALKYIFKKEEKEPENNRMITFFKERSIVAKIEGIP